MLPIESAAQNRVQIVRADSIVGGSVQGTPVQKILGNVNLQTEEFEMFADSAYKFDSRQLVQAFGNIQINTPEETIWADTLTYYTDIDFSELRGRVIIKSDSSTLFGNSVDYRFTNKVAHFRDKIRLEDQEGVLIANSGFYFREPDSATFSGNVQLRDSLQYIEGDDLYSNRRSEYYELHGNVFADDPENDSMLKGDYLEADSTGRRLVKGNAWLKNFKEDSAAAENDSIRADTFSPADSAAPADSETFFRPDSLNPPISSDSLLSSADSIQTARPDTSQNSQPDTTHIRAATILSLQNRTPSDTTTTVKSYKNVRIWSPDFSSVSDTAEYESETQTFELWSNAKAWHEQIQLTGPYIWVKLEEGDISELISHPDPFTVQQDTLINRLNQIKGDTLNASFENGELRLIRVFRNSHLLRFTDKSGKPDGVIELRAPITNLLFERGKLIELKSLGMQELIDGKKLPESEKTKEKRLDGFSWNPKERPQRPKQEMKPRLPPIPLRPPFKLPGRYIDLVGRTDSTVAKIDSLQMRSDSLAIKQDSLESPTDSPGSNHNR
jgi:lipopolysaccharide export system protein LptA